MPDELGHPNVTAVLESKNLILKKEVRKQLRIQIDYSINQSICRCIFSSDDFFLRECVLFPMIFSLSVTDEVLVP